MKIQPVTAAWLRRGYLLFLALGGLAALALLQFPVQAGIPFDHPPAPASLSDPIPVITNTLKLEGGESSP
jgi:hypothetical protein